MTVFLLKISDQYYYSLKDLAEYTNIPLSTWRYWTKMSKINYIKMGHRGTKYILGSDVKGFLAKHSVKKMSNYKSHRR